MPPGRKTVITPEIEVKLEEMFRIDATTGEACTYAGIAQSTFYEHMKKDEKFKQKMENSRNFPFLVAKKVIIKAINDGNGELALKVLKSRQREIYYEKTKNDTELTGKDGGDIPMIIRVKYE